MDMLPPFIQAPVDGVEQVRILRRLVTNRSRAVSRVIELPPSENGAEPISSFQPEASEVLHGLRLSIAATLSDIGDFSKPADVHKVLQLDRTLARQLFRLASTSEALGSGGMIPSRASIDRFLTTAVAHGASADKINSVRVAYGVFERLVQTHAGDRATFNSMVSAAGGLDESWHATDLQHRRNAFRAMSHAVGVQAKTRLLMFILKDNPGQESYEVAGLSGFIGLRVLRSFPTVRVFGITAVSDKETSSSSFSCGPLGLSGSGSEYVLETFSSAPLPRLLTTEEDSERGPYREIVLDHPVVGKVGSSTLMFGTLFRGVPVNYKDPMQLSAGGGKPVETLIFDMLTCPNWRGGAIPTGRAIMGLSDKYNPEIINLQGNFETEYLGKGAGALSTPEVPRYTEMLAATGSTLGWDLDHYDAWRIRVEFPIYQSTVVIQWPPLTKPEK